MTPSQNFISSILLIIHLSFSRQIQLKSTESRTSFPGMKFFDLLISRTYRVILSFGAEHDNSKPIVARIIAFFIVFSNYGHFDCLFCSIIHRQVNKCPSANRNFRMYYPLLIRSTNSLGVSISILEKPNHFLPKSFMDAPM